MDEDVWYYYKKDGQTVKSRVPPAGKRCAVVTPNETYGMAVCVQHDPVMRAIIRSGIEAEAACEQALREKHDAIRKKVAEQRKSTKARWDAATERVTQARKVVADQIEELNDLRWWHDKFHDGLALAIDGAGIVLAANPWVAGALLVAGAANTLIKGSDQILAGQGTAPIATAGTGAFADGVSMYAEGSGQVVRGIPALNVAIIGKDAISLFSDVQKYPFSSPESVDAVKLIKDYFANSDRNWTEDMFGPSQKELDKNLDSLIKAMEEEQTAQKAYAEAIEGRELERLGPEMATCIDKTQTRIFVNGQ